MNAQYKSCDQFNHWKFSQYFILWFLFLFTVAVTINDVRFQYVGISFFLGISSIQSSFGDESTADTPLQSPIKQEEVRNGR